ncbi:MAG: DUF2267 domain-containing protein [Aurantimonas endophytica]|uniref:DUF2267 domain-containing protein n=1 Tax=Aurantimonas endophytica TaxID=1522175 RepID=UPI003001D7BA
MSHTTISTFTQSAQQAQHWVNELSEDLGWTSERNTYRLLRAVLHALRDWLTLEEVADLSAQLPMLIRGMLFENWRPSLIWQVTDRSKDDFTMRVEKEFGDEALGDPDKAVAAVFRLIDKHISPGEARQVRGELRKSLQGLWPSH